MTDDDNKNVKELDLRMTKSPSTCIPQYNLNFINATNTSHSVWGVAIVRRGFVATKHFHREAEMYYFLYGRGKLAVNDDIHIATAPCMRYIPPNAVHAMTPLSDYVILVYSFPTGPYESIRYNFTNSHL